MSDIVDRSPKDATTAPLPAPSDPGLVEITDLAIAVGLPLLTAISWLLPPSAWRGFCRVCVPFYGPGQSGQPSTPSVSQRVERIVGARAPNFSAKAVVGDVIAEDILSLIELLRVYRPGGWNPVIELAGGDHVASALAEGRGAILWVSHFVHSDLVAKMAFHRAGVAVSHLSHPRHGFSSSRFGMSCLNRIKTVAEDRHLAARVMLDDQRPATALKSLQSRLEGNGVVSISVRGGRRNSVSVPFLGGEIRLAGGASRLSRATGAALLPVFPVRNGNGGFTVEVEPALDPDNAEADYASRLEHHVLAHPGQWLGWFHL